ncbi:amino acid ABC transporter substrate-binding protein [Aquibium oceanicum]|uniref:Branched-chain amino acid ABC transporter substrate-binding protein n=1 Tax=Aquibium oceanicum TaxID=1670800 RepID=A0A1L3SPI6_9HYPH|nr:amino acid ABC transporter substrate-binding protein [Aquibium oceanicum]APH71271.1 branched-chain amino acid ABC transporter substrate-binding protein [Aquibium oceanicum]
MLRRSFITLAASAAVLAGAGTSGFAQEETIKLGASAPKSGPLAGGAAMTHWPNIQLWMKEVNDAGGLKVGDKQMKIELVEYDDKTSGEEAIKNIQRLATVDEVDFLVAPYSTGLNIAAAPAIARYGYPQIATTAATDGVKEFAERWPNSFWMLGTSTQLANGIVDTISKMKEKGDIGNKVALVNVADAFGLELIGAAKPALEKAGFEIVYETSYPLGTQDLAPVISQAKAAAPDAFIAFSYPGDTFALTEQAQVQGFDVPVFYTGVGTAFPPFAKRFGDAANGIMGIGGINSSDENVKGYLDMHKADLGSDPDFWASATTYAGLQILGQAIEKAGSLDKAAVVEAIKTGTFDTVIGPVSMPNNVNEKVWTVGQWNNGVFEAVAAEGMPVAAEPAKKSGW